MPVAGTEAPPVTVVESTVVTLRRTPFSTARPNGWAVR